MCLFGCHSRKSNHPADNLVMGTTVTLYSNILKQEREIWINIPDNYNSSSLTNCPVLYLLDAEGNFNTITQEIRELKKRNNTENLAKLIIVGIRNINRIHDLTPSNDPEPSKSSFLPITDSLFQTSGGGDNFVFFIKDELIPYIDSLYQPSAVRIFAGHSLGGLLVLHTLINYTDVFTGYIALDPSIWWDKQKIITQTKRALTEKDFKGVSLFLANSNSAKKNARKYQTENLGNPYLIQLELKNSFERNKQNNLKFVWNFYKYETHSSITKKAFFDGLVFMLE